jgi:SAM-dependent methyltransferase
MTTTNHHANYPGFAGVTGLLAGLIMNLVGGPTARLVADLAELSAADCVIDVGCGPGTAVREAARRGARAIGVDPAPVMLRLARMLTRDQARITWIMGPAENIRRPNGSASVYGRWPLCITGQTLPQDSLKHGEFSLGADGS